MNTVSQDKQKLHAKAKENEEFIHHFPWAGLCLSLESRTSTHVTVTGKDKYNNPKCPLFLLFEILLLSMMLYGMG